MKKIKFNRVVKFIFGVFILVFFEVVVLFLMNPPLWVFFIATLLGAFIYLSFDPYGFFEERNEGAKEDKEKRQFFRDDIRIFSSVILICLGVLAFIFNLIAEYAFAIIIAAILSFLKPRKEDEHV